MQLMTGEGNNIRPIWTPDGERLTFTSDRDGTQRIYWQAADLSGTATPLTPSEPGVNHQVDSWSPDGRTLSFAKLPFPLSVWTLTLDEEGEPAEPELFVGGTAGSDSFSSAFAPDGQWLVYLSQAAIGGEQLFIEPFPATGTRFQLTQNGGSNPLWSRDGRELFYRRGAGGARAGTPTLLTVDITLESTPRFSDERAMPIEGFAVTGSREYDITPDGERFIMVFPSDETESGETARPQINIVLNWFQELKERVPVP